jgi:hypothetical protein
MASLQDCSWWSASSSATRHRIISRCPREAAMHSRELEPPWYTSSITTSTSTRAPRSVTIIEDASL